ncbi:hydrogenase nickel incorporation protein [Raoultella terrigena]|uniref:Hydrogenase nickel incorporation protein n=1 Tax=Raoultella terrigena TaxID=577 RepID=A0A3P8KTP4_RAOTE|nr:hydrogenase nickel incorporation protein [Raoultella terrigena]
MWRPPCTKSLLASGRWKIIEQQAQQAGARRVSGVWLKVGAFSCVEASALTFCFELVCRGTLAEGCELHIAEQQAECWCESCQQYVQLISQHVRRCPQWSERRAADRGGRWPTDSENRSDPRLIRPGLRRPTRERGQHRHNVQYDGIDQE